MKKKEREDIYPIMEEFFKALYVTSNPVFKFKLNPVIVEISTYLLNEVQNFKTNLEKEQFKLFFDKYEYFLIINIECHSFQLRLNDDVKKIKTDLKHIGEILILDTHKKFWFNYFFIIIDAFCEIFNIKSKIKMGFEKFHKINSTSFISKITAIKNEFEIEITKLNQNKDDLLISDFAIGGGENKPFHENFYLFN